MGGDQIHFELFVRRRVNAPWTLELANEDRARVIAAAEELLSTGQVAAVRVTKEALDPDTREFKSYVVLTKGAVEAKGQRPMREVDDTPLCVSPQDLYTVHARERIGRLLDGWLRRKAVTPFELLHRSDLAEQLDASGVELQHAVQKIAIPEAQARGMTTHEAIRTFQKLVDRTVERVMRDGRRDAFPNVSDGRFGEAACRLCEEDGERAYLLGGGVAAHLSAARNWAEKVGLILDLADAAPAGGRARALALGVLEQPLGEILGSRAGLADLLGSDLDLGASLAALTRLAGGDEVAALVDADPSLLREMPPLFGQADRLADWLKREAFEGTRAALGRRVVRELTGPRRLRPGDAEGEIAILRALAMALTAATGKLLPIEDVQAAFAERSRALVSADFVEAFLAGRESAMAEAEGLVRLAENVAGGVNKRAAARWIAASVGALRFEKELRSGPDTPAHKLAALAALQRLVRKVGLADADTAPVCAKIGEVGGLIEAEARLVVLMARVEAPLPQKLTLMLRMACGEAAPAGPAADRAKSEVLKLLRAPDLRTELAAAPDAFNRIRGLMSQAGLAA